jgi:hypothetical protein
VAVSDSEMSNALQGSEQQGLCGAILWFVAQAKARFDAEIAEKGHFW